jgi:hypothetical protein
MISLLIGAAVAGGTYLYAKQRKAGTGESVAAAAVTGVGSAVATALVSAMFWPIVFIGGPLAVGYYLGKKNGPKALPPG